MFYIFSLILTFLTALLSSAQAADISAASWSETDASNNAAPPNGWPANMVASAVEPSARAMMGGIKRWYDHQNCVQTSTGSANAQVLSFSVAPSALVAGDVYCFLVGSGLTNTGATTLNVGVGGAKTVLMENGQPLTGGELQQNNYALVVYDGTEFAIVGYNALSAPVLVRGGNLSLDNNTAIQFMDNGGTYRSVLALDGSNNLHLNNIGGGTIFFGPGVGGIDNSGNMTLGGTGNGTVHFQHGYVGYTGSAVGLFNNPGLGGFQNFNDGSIEVSATSGSYNCIMSSSFSPNWGCSSDARFKNFKPLTMANGGTATSAVMELAPVSFTWKVDRDRHPHMGFLAQDVEKVFPELVGTGPDGTMMLAEDGLIPPLVLAVQELSKRVEALETELKKARHR